MWFKIPNNANHFLRIASLQRVVKMCHHDPRDCRCGMVLETTVSSSAIVFPLSTPVATKPAFCKGSARRDYVELSQSDLSKPRPKPVASGR